ncbi:6-bladed beta-propeller [Phocaeicola coprophilus]|jgi:hypothetical protein|uniref:6-bladed beta-propeller n=3 Tax=Phocaeicola coprophilus TaxID=387090 RepID=A0A413T081_9BACT|nr:6-bladed beta-propeller [Phocaeicola coprophilus]
MSLLYSRLYLILYRIHVFMKMKKLFSYLLLLAFLSAAGCAKKNASAYYSNGVKPDSVYTVEVHTLNDSSIWCFPLQMECTDSLLVILDYMDDCYFHVYTLSGNPKGKFARKGQGPGELLSANQFHLSPGKDTLYVYDGVSRKLVAYNLDTNLERDRSFTEYKIDYSILPPSETPFIIYDLLPLGGNQFLLKANQPKLRYGCINLATKQITSVYKDFPSEYVTGNAEEIWSVFSSDTRTFFKPDYARMFNATYIGGILELFSVGSGWELAMDTTLCIYEPVYGLAEGTVPAFVVGNEKTQLGFEDAYAGNEFIYALLHEKGDAMEPESVIVFDWQGNAVKEMRTGQRLARFCVDETHNVIYALASDEENGYKLVRICSD